MEAFSAPYNCAAWSTVSPGEKGWRRQSAIPFTVVYEHQIICNEVTSIWIMLKYHQVWTLSAECIIRQQKKEMEAELMVRWGEPQAL